MKIIIDENFETFQVVLDENGIMVVYYNGQPIAQIETDPPAAIFSNDGRVYYVMEDDALIQFPMLACTLRIHNYQLITSC